MLYESTIGLRYIKNVIFGSNQVIWVQSGRSITDTFFNVDEAFVF